MSKLNYSALRRYANAGNNEKLTSLLSKSREYDVLPKDDLGRYVALSAKGQHWECVKLLLQYSIDNLDKYDDGNIRLSEALKEIRAWAPGHEMPEEIESMVKEHTIIGDSTSVSSDSDDDRGLGDVEGFTYNGGNEGAVGLTGVETVAAVVDDC